MARGAYTVAQMVIEGTNLGLMNLRPDVIDRFGISLTTIAPTATTGTRERTAHVRQIYSNSNTASTTRTTSVNRTLIADVKRKNKVNSGKAIKVPTDLNSTPSRPAPAAGTTPVPAKVTPRMTVIRFPHKASNYQIARWINLYFTANKPAYFITPAGARYPVNVPEILAATAGESGAASPGA